MHCVDGRSHLKLGRTRGENESLPAGMKKDKV